MESGNSGETAGKRRRNGAHGRRCRKNGPALLLGLGGSRLREHLERFGRSPRHLLESRASRVHCGLQRGHRILVVDRHAGEHLLHRLEHLLAAGGKLFADEFSDFRLGAIRQFRHFTCARQHFFRRALRVLGAQFDRLFRILDAGKRLGVLHPFFEQAFRHRNLQFHDALRVFDRHLRQTHCRFEIFLLKLVDLVLFGCHFLSPRAKFEHWNYQALRAPYVRRRSLAPVSGYITGGWSRRNTALPVPVAL